VLVLDSGVYGCSRREGDRRGAGRGRLLAVRVGVIAEDSCWEWGMVWGAGGGEGVQVRCHDEREIGKVIQRQD
jgi:hypothetical protein